MKKLLVLSHGRITGKNLCSELNKILGQWVDIIAFSSEDKLPDDFHKHLILVTTDAVLSGPLNRYLKNNSNWIMAQRVINYTYLEPVIELDEGLDVLLVNDHERTTEVAIEQLKGLGLNHINYTPYYPGCRLSKKYAVAVTPGEPHLVPASVEHVIDIATRQIDITTIIEIAQRLDILKHIRRTLSSQYVSDFVNVLRRLNTKAKEAESIKKSFERLADHSGDGIVYTNYLGDIQIMNRSAKKYFKKESIHGLNIKTLIPKLKGLEITIEGREVIKILGKDVFVACSVVDESEFSELIYVFEDVSELRQLEHEIRRRSRKREHIAQYTFDAIKHQSKVIEDLIKLGNQLALSESTVLIEGESGTGKELFAQGMHMASNRNSGPFVPVNFAALPYTLLESELFGYEEGAFTGAQKGGKVGLLEAAHGGTLFLDEIGDAPLEFQVRLLRVLQEKQIRRVGGRKIIPIDVRVIVATNRDLHTEVKQGRFREDLFYRLSVLPVKIPSLRHRKEDISYLLHYFMLEYGQKDVKKLDELFEPETINYLTNYNWPGNVRQLMNVMEYVCHIYKMDKPTKVDQLPSYMQYAKKEKSNEMIRDLMGTELIWILEQLDTYGDMGRRQIAEKASQQDVQLTEGKIRKWMLLAEEKGLIETHQGRRGSTLTPKGMDLLKII